MPLYNVTYSACQSFSGNQPLDKIMALSPKAHIWSGDFVYNDGAGIDALGQNYYDTIFWDYAAAPTGDPSNAHNPTTCYNRFHYRYGRAGLRRYQEWWAWARANGVRNYMLPDDHDCKHNNFDHSIAQSAATWVVGQPASAPVGNRQIHAITTQAQVLAIWRLGMQGVRAILKDYADNPPLDFSKYNGDIPKEMVGTAVPADYPIEYFYVDMDDKGNIGGNTVRLVFPASVAYKNKMGDTDNATKQFWGAQQEEWLFAVGLDAKQKGFGMVIYCSSKDLFNVDNNDGPWTYSTRRDILLQRLHNAGIPSCWLTGDKHVPHAAVALTANGYSYDCVCVCACPFGQGCGNLAQYAQNNWYASRNDQAVFGNIQIDSTAKTVQLQIIDAFTGDLEYAITIPFYSSKPSAIYMAPNEAWVPSPSRAPISITPTASPMVYKNTTGGQLMISASAVTSVSQLRLSRDNSTWAVVHAVPTATAASHCLEPGDFIEITFAGTLTLNAYPTGRVGGYASGYGV